MKPRTFILATLALAGTLPGAGAHAQWYSSYPSAPSYSYGGPQQQPYAVEVAPNTYVIHRPEKARANVRSDDGIEQSEIERPRRTHADRALIDEMGRRHSKVKVVNTYTKQVVPEKPTVINHVHVVDDPPRIIERRHITEDAGRGLIRNRREVAEQDVVISPGGAPPQAERHVKRRVIVRDETSEPPPHGPAGKRVIHAEAEVTILGPDRMSIRLYRKGGDDAKAEAK